MTAVDPAVDLRAYLEIYSSISSACLCWSDANGDGSVVQIVLVMVMV